MKISETTMNKLNKYSDKSLKTYGIILIALGVLLLPVIVGVVFIVIGVGYLNVIKARHIPKSLSDLSMANENKTITKKDESKQNYDLFENVLKGSILSYDYEENIYLTDNIISKISGNGGKELSFIQEPNNEYDGKAISVYLGNLKIGYVYKGKIQDMLNDWILRNDIFFGYINKIFVNDNKATYKIGFYKPIERFANKTFTLAKTNKRIDEDTKREDNLYSVSEGEEVTIEYDNELESYLVFNNSYEEMGELPSSASDFIRNSSCDEYIGIVSEYKENENGIPKLKITVCLK